MTAIHRFKVIWIVLNILVFMALLIFYVIIHVFVKRIDLANKHYNYISKLIDNL